MIARVASFEGINVEVAEKTMEDADKIIRPMVEGLAGYAGHLELSSSDGKALSITFFDSEENARAAEQTFDQDMPQALGEVFKDWEGRRVSVGIYQVQADERQ